MKQMITDYLVGTRSLRAALPWMGFTALILVCQWVKHESGTTKEWAKDFADFVTIGATTALFTRFLGGMGMFRDAISDVMLDEKWINRRNDLEEVWGRLTRHIFMPGFSSKVPEAEGLSEALNKTMKKSVLRPEQKVNYYAKNMIRRIYIDWLDKEKRVVRIRDVLTTTIIPFDEKNGCDYQMVFTPTSSEKITDYTLQIVHISIDGIEEDVKNYEPEIVGNLAKISIKLKGKYPRLSRTTISTQSIEDDPIFVVCAGRVVWGMQAVISVGADRLRINFEEVGIDGSFMEEPSMGGGRPGADAAQLDRVKPIPEIAYFTKDALLPEQGFMIVMAPVPEGRPQVAHPVQETLTTPSQAG